MSEEKVRKMIVPEQDGNNNQKFGKSYPNKMMDDYEKRAQSEARRGLSTPPPIPSNVIPAELAEALRTVQARVQAQISDQKKQ